MFRLAIWLPGYLALGLAIWLSGSRGGPRASNISLADRC